VRTFASEGRPVLGICIGMQVLFEESDEHGLHRGLGLLPGRVERLPSSVRVPHMGWNVLEVTRPHQVLQGLQGGEYVYFVHSYACRAADEVVLATTDYGGPVAAVVGRGSVLGMQFHPEKSQSVGLGLVKRFSEMVVSTSRRSREFALPDGVLS
jgi:imidazole glycerol-phosphate synthase subunit HisH